MKKNDRQMIDLFEYDNYRAYLGDLYNHLKKTKPYFSYRHFSMQAGFKSPNFLKLIIDGKRNLSSESIDKFIKALKFNQTESKHFRNLILLNQSQTIEEKKYYAEQLIKSKLFLKAHPLKKELYEYYSNWYFIAIRELVYLKNFQEDPEWIANQIEPSITKKEAAYALEVLQKLGLIKKDACGNLKQTSKFVTTDDEVSNLSVTEYHQVMMDLAKSSIERIPAESREISSVTLSLSESGAKQVKSLIQDFKRELMAIANTDQNENGVFQVNFQMFPLSKIERSKP